MNDTVLQQQEAVRRSGRTNMLDVTTVTLIAVDAGFDELVVWIEDHSHSEYVAMASRAAEQFDASDELDYSV